MLWCMRVCVCVFVCWLFASIECVCVCWMYSERHWRRWSTIHWWWSQVTCSTYNTEFELWVMCGDVCGCIWYLCWLYVLIICVCVCVCGCTVNDIGDVGAQSIGDGLKSLTSLATLDLSCEWCVVMYAGVYGICVDCVCWLNAFVWLCVLDVQSTTLATLEHNPLVMVSSHSHHLQHWIWEVSDVWRVRVCVCLLIVCINWMRLCLCVLDVQVTTLDTLEHNPLVMVSSHSHHLQHCIWMVSDVVMYAGVCLCVDCMH